MSKIIRNHDMALNSYHDMARTDIAGTGTGTINDQKRTLDMVMNRPMRWQGIGLMSWQGIGFISWPGTGTINDQKRTLDMVRNRTDEMARNRTDAMTWPRIGPMT